MRMTRATFLSLALLAISIAGCSKPKPLTEKGAQAIISAWAYKTEPIYAEVPQRVWWNPKSPKDDYDGLAVRTLQNLKGAGLITVTETVTADSAEYRARVTKKGFNILGTAPSHRGAVYRGKIAEKVYDGIRNFQRHPNEPTTGHAELVWHYDNPTPLYPFFETKINKPLEKPFVSQVSFYYKNHQWKFDVIVKKTEAE